MQNSQRYTEGRDQSSKFSCTFIRIKNLFAIKKKRIILARVIRWTLLMIDLEGIIVDITDIISVKTRITKYH